MYGRYRDDLIFVMDRFTAPLLRKLICAHAEPEGYEIGFEQMSMNKVDYLDGTDFKGPNWFITGKL